MEQQSLLRWFSEKENSTTNQPTTTKTLQAPPCTAAQGVTLPHIKCDPSVPQPAVVTPTNDPPTENKTKETMEEKDDNDRKRKSNCLQNNDDDDDCIVIDAPTRGIATITSSSSSDDDCVVIDAPLQVIATITSSSSSSSSSQTVPADDSKELEIVGTTGQNALEDFPHARQDCVKFPMNKSTAIFFCNNCYCYVCDVKASECPSWLNSHCRAKKGDFLFENMRRQARRNRKQLEKSSANPLLRAPIMRQLVRMSIILLFLLCHC